VVINFVVEIKILQESKERQSLLGRYRTLEHEYDGTNAVYEEELAAKDHLARQCQKAEAEANLWRLKVYNSNHNKTLDYL
jgi:hypothetical protein